MRLTEVLAGAREGHNQEHLIWLLWVGADDCALVDASRWGGFGFIYHEDVGAKRTRHPELSIMPMRDFMALVTSLNATWVQFFADRSSDFRDILVAHELAACRARIAWYLRQAPPGCWRLDEPMPPGILKNYPHVYPPPPPAH